MKLSIIVPCYNEAANIPPLLLAFAEVIKRDDIEVILVNNGSSDESEQVLIAEAPSYSFLKVEKVPLNKGYGYGIMAGLNAASGRFLGWTHADLQTDPVDVIKALDIIEQYNDSSELYVKGNRKGRPWVDQLFTSGMSLFESLYMGRRLWDINAQPNIFHRQFFDRWKDTAPDDFSLDLFVLYMAKYRQLNIQRFDVIFPQRQHGESSWNTSLGAKWKFIKRTLAFSVQLKKELKT